MSVVPGPGRWCAWLNLEVFPIPSVIASVVALVVEVRALARRLLSFSLRPLVSSVLVLALVPLASIALDRGAAAPEFTLPLLSPAVESPDAFRTLLQLSDYRGKVIYLDFWDSSCSPCRRSLPLLSQLRDQFARTDIEFVAINLDTDPNAALRFLAAHPVSYPVVSDPSTRSAIDYSVASLPTAFFISRDGLVRGMHHGFQANDINKIKTILTEMIGVDRG